MRCIKCEWMVEDTCLGNLCAACTNREFHLEEAKKEFQGESDGDTLQYPQIYALLVNEPHDQTTYHIVTEGDEEVFFVGEDRKEAIREYEEQLLVPGDAFTEVASCMKLSTQIRLLLKSNSKEAERLLSLWWDKKIA